MVVIMVVYRANHVEDGIPLAFNKVRYDVDISATDAAA